MLDNLSSHINDFWISMAAFGCVLRAINIYMVPALRHNVKAV
jgi:hypothetical protein